MKAQRKTATRKTDCGGNKFPDIKQTEGRKNKVTEQHLYEVVVVVVVVAAVAVVVVVVVVMFS